MEKKKAKGSGQLSLGDLKELTRFMKAQGVHLFKAGDVIVQFNPGAGPSDYVNPLPPSDETPEQKEAREKREFEEILFHSAHAGG